MYNHHLLTEDSLAPGVVRYACACRSRFGKLAIAGANGSGSGCAAVAKISMVRIFPDWDSLLVTSSAISSFENPGCGLASVLFRTVKAVLIVTKSVSCIIPAIASKDKENGCSKSRLS